MITTLTVGELLLGLGILLMATWELAQLVAARCESKTTNVSRVVAHLVIMAAVVVYLGYLLYWWRLMEIPVLAEAGTAVPDTNLPILFLGAVIGLVLGHEIIGHLRARRAGLTTNISRLVTHIVMILALASLLAMSIAKWEAYLDRLESTYEQSIPVE